jgi:hypothetical protein
MDTDLVEGSEALRVIRNGVEMSISFLDLKAGDRFTYQKKWYQVSEIGAEPDGSSQIMTEEVPEWNDGRPSSVPQSK